MRFAARIRAVAGATFNAADIYFGARTTANYTQWQNFIALDGGANFGTGDFDSFSGLFVSPVFVIPSGTVAVDAKLGFYNTDVTFDVRQFGVFKVIENG